MNGASFAVSILVGLWFTPYLIVHLGKAEYGLVPLTGTIVSYLTILTAGIGVAVSRFVTIALEQRDVFHANRIFCTAQVTLVGITLFSIIPVVFLSYFADSIIRVPVGAERDVQWLFACCGVAFLITTATGAYGVSAFCRNRLDIPAWLSIISMFLRVAVVVVLFALGKAYLWEVGVGLLIGSIFSGLGQVWASRYLAPELETRLANWNGAEFKRITSTATWVCVSQIGTVLLIGIDLVVVNRFFGPLANTQYAIALQWSIVLRGIAGVLGNLFAPRITSLHARSDNRGVVAYTLRSMKFTGLLIALPIGLACGLAHSFLTVWVGSAFSNISPLLVLLTLPLALNLAYLPLHQVCLATNKVRVPGLVQIGAGVSNLILAIVLANSPLRMYGVALAGGFVLSLRNLLFTPIYAARAIDYPIATFFSVMPACIVATLLAFGLAFLGQVWLSPANWLLLGVAALIVAIVYVVVVYTALLSREERTEVCDFIRVYGNKILLLLAPSNANV